MNAAGWPICTANGGCLHERTYTGDEYVREHKDEFVNRNGYAACACCADLAERYGVTPFPCDKSEAA